MPTVTLIEKDETPLDQDPENHIEEAIRGDRGASILGPRNAFVEFENPDLLASPYTDAGTIPNLKFPFSAAQSSRARWMGARSHSARAPGRDNDGRCEYAPHARRHPGVALAQSCRVGVHASRAGSNPHWWLRAQPCVLTRSHIPRRERIK
jgi:hypothetical protein